MTLSSTYQVALAISFVHKVPRVPSALIAHCELGPILFVTFIFLHQSLEVVDVDIVGRQSGRWAKRLLQVLDKGIEPVYIRPGGASKDQWATGEHLGQCLLNTGSHFVKLDS